nr:collagen alpha-1(I) chain-like [Globicephala melas]
MSPTPSLSSVWEPREGRAGRGYGDAGGSRGPGGRRQGGPRAPKAGSASPRLSPVGRRPSLPSWLREETTSSILSGPRGELGATPTRPGKPGLGPAARPPGRRPLPAPHLAPAGATGPGQTPLPPPLAKMEAAAGPRAGRPPVGRAGPSPAGPPRPSPWASALVGSEADDPSPWREGMQVPAGLGPVGPGELRPRSHLGGRTRLLFAVYTYVPGARHGLCGSRGST